MSIHFDVSQSDRFQYIQNFNYSNSISNEPSVNCTGSIPRINHTTVSKYLKNQFVLIYQIRQKLLEITDFRFEAIPLNAHTITGHLLILMTTQHETDLKT